MSQIGHREKTKRREKKKKNPPPPRRDHQSVEDGKMAQSVPEGAHRQNREAAQVALQELLHPMEIHEVPIGTHLPGGGLGMLGTQPELRVKADAVERISMRAGAA